MFCLKEMFVRSLSRSLQNVNRSSIWNVSQVRQLNCFSKRVPHRYHYPYTIQSMSFRTTSQACFLAPQQGGGNVYKYIIIPIVFVFGVGIFGYVTLSKKEDNEFKKALDKIRLADPDYKKPKLGKDVPLRAVFRCENGYPIKVAVVFQHNGRVFEMEKATIAKVFGMDSERTKVWRATKDYNNSEDDLPDWYKYVEEGITLSDIVGVGTDINKYDRMNWNVERRFSYLTTVKDSNGAIRGRQINHRIRTNIESAKGNKNVKLGVELLTYDHSKSCSRSITYTFLYSGTQPLPNNIITEFKDKWRDSFAEMVVSTKPEDTEEEQEVYDEIKEKESDITKLLSQKEEKN